MASESRARHVVARGVTALGHHRRPAQSELLKGAVAARIDEIRDQRDRLASIGSWCGLDFLTKSV